MEIKSVCLVPAGACEARAGTAVPRKFRPKPASRGNNWVIEAPSLPWPRLGFAPYPGRIGSQRLRDRPDCNGRHVVAVQFRDARNKLVGLVGPSLEDCGDFVRFLDRA